MGDPAILAGSLVAVALSYPGFLAIAGWRRRRRDRALAAAAWNAILAAEFVPRSLVVRAQNGCVTLEGEVDELPQALAAVELVAGVPGVRGIHNLIRLRGVAPAWRET